MATYLLELIGRVLWGFRPRLMSYIVQRKGPVKALLWFAQNMPKYESILKQWGPVRTHLVTTYLSTLGGCRYCASGHAQALQLHFLKQTGKILSLSTDDMLELRIKNRDTIFGAFSNMLDEAGIDEETAVLQRVMFLQDNPAAANSTTDQQLIHLIDMFRELNACGVGGDVAPDAIHDPINKDVNIQRRYEALRTEHESSRQQPDQHVAHSRDLASS